MNKFLEQLRFTYCNVDKPKKKLKILDYCVCEGREIDVTLFLRVTLPKAQIIPNITQNIPPIIGSGIMMNTAPNLLIIPCKIIRTHAHCMTLRLPTLVTPNSYSFASVVRFCQKQQRNNIK